MEASVLEQAKITTLLDARLENLVGLKKVRSVGVGTWTTNGLQITVKGKKVSLFFPCLLGAAEAGAGA